MADGVKNGDTVRVNYTGRLDSGEVFDSSEVGGEPLEFTVGAEQVIPGFEEAVRGMEVGDRKMVKIPSDEAYGPRVEQLVSAVPREGVNFGAEPEVVMNLVMQLPDGN